MGGTARVRTLSFHDITRLHRLRRGKLPNMRGILPREPKKSDSELRKERIAEILASRKGPKAGLTELEKELDAVGILSKVGDKTRLAGDGMTAGFEGIDRGNAILNLWMDDADKAHQLKPLADESGKQIRLTVPSNGYTEAVAVNEDGKYLVTAARIKAEEGVRIFVKQIRERAGVERRADPELEPLIEGYKVSDAFAELQEIFANELIRIKEDGKNTPLLSEEKKETIRNGPAKIMAQKVVEETKNAANDCGYGFCVLNSRGRASCKWSFFRPFVTLGIIREDGKVSPIVVHEKAICKYTDKNKTGESWKGVPTAMASEIIGEQLCPESFEILKVRKASQEELDKELFEAISHGRIFNVWIALEDGADPNARCENGNPALLHSVPNYEITKLMLEKGANPNVIGESDGRTPLMKAAMMDTTELPFKAHKVGPRAIVDLLIRYGAEVDYLGRGRYRGKSALDCAKDAYKGSNTEALKGYQALDGEELQRRLNEKLLQRSYWWQPEKLRKLLEKGANPNVKRGDDNNPVLAMVIEGEEKEAAVVLIEGGANPNANSSMLEAPVLIAAFYFDSGGEVARALIKAGAQLSVRDKDGRSPLEWAIDNDDAKTCQMLLDTGVSPNEKLYGTTTSNPLQKALRDKRSKVAEVLKKNGAMIMPQHELDERLFDAARFLRVNQVKEALEWGANPNAKDPREYNETALIKICKEGDSEKTEPARIEIAMALVDAGADVDAKSEIDCTPLSESCGFGHLKIVKILLEKNADPNLKGNAGIPPIISAAAGRVPEGHESTEIVQLLIDAGADINAQAYLNIEEKTALHAAAKNRKSKIVKLLLEHGADASVKNCDNKNAQQVAAFDGEYDEETVKVLEEDSKEEQDQKLLEAAETGDSKAAAKAMDRGARFNARDSANRTALMIALLHGHESEGYLDTAHTLLNYGASVNVTDDYGNTPLYYAVTAGDEIVERLIHMGAEINPKSDASFESPLIEAASNGSLGVLQLLVDNKADASARGFKNTTALIEAATYSSAEHVVALLMAGADILARDDQDNHAMRAAIRRDEPEKTRMVNALKLSLLAQALEAVKEKDTEKVREIVNVGADREPILEEAKKAGNTEIVEMLEGIGKKPANPKEEAPEEKRKTRTPGELRNMIKVSKLADHVNGFGLGSRESFFRAVYAMRMINKGKSRGGWSITMNGAGNVEKEEEHLPEGEFERLRDSENAGEFARDVIGQLERLADKLGQDICTINPVIIDSLPGSAMNMTPPAISIVVGLINEEGKIALLVLSDEYMMVQTGSGPFSASYNEFEAGKLTTYDIERLAMTGLMDESYI